ncbi:MAG TPA: carboxypeptidase-like regulatory domain-containing protein [Sunxiuqinia sp.]|nr:carboxypeptidase-like regulatory domain-containing protein [Sunxiuqinia sp.]
MKTPFLVFGLVMICLTTAAGNRDSQVWGKVVDKQTNRPIYGVNISLQNVSNGLGTITNAKGEFRLWNIPGDSAQILISYEGYQSLQWNIESLHKMKHNKNSMTVIYLNERSAVENTPGKRKLMVYSDPKNQAATTP